MILHAKHALIDLAYREIVPIADAAGTRIDCVRGRLWITEPRRADDVVLEAGGSYVIARAGVALVQALRHSRIGLWSLRERPIGPACRRRHSNPPKEPLP
jgi:hypothetical protein